VVSRIGRGEIGAHSDPVNNAEIFVDLLPPEEWTTAEGSEALVIAMQESLAEVPGVQLNFTQPIAAAVDELLTGTRAQIAIKLFGDDLDFARNDRGRGRGRGSENGKLNGHGVTPLGRPSAVLSDRTRLGRGPHRA